MIAMMQLPTVAWTRPGDGSINGSTLRTLSSVISTAHTAAQFPGARAARNGAASPERTVHTDWAATSASPAAIATAPASSVGARLRPASSRA